MLAMPNGRRGRVSALAASTLAVVIMTSPSGASALPTNTPLPASDYAARPACGAALPGQARCLAERLVPKTPAARTRTHPLGVTLPPGVGASGEASTAAYGLRPEDLHNAYDLPTDAPGTPTIALIDAYDDPSAEADLQVYDETFGLPACTTANRCFRKINQHGGASPLPETNWEWAGEIALDVETAHAVCQNCHILLVEAETSYSDDLEAAVDTAVAEGAEEISNSYGSPSPYYEGGYDHPGVVITASTGDWGYDNWVSPEWGEEANAPASLPSVVAVGGTSLDLSGESWSAETPWLEGGSGCTEYESAPAWQAGVSDWAQVGCGTRRATADVAADADPYTGMAIYNSNEFGWGTWGGTSLASPIIAATFALAGGSHGVEYPALTLYRHLGTSGLHDIVSGSNWGCADSGGCTVAEEEANCSEALICNAAPGYDGPTGVGTPDGLTAFGGETPGPPPTITSVSPSRGEVNEGATVTIEGTKLKDPERVMFGTERARVLTDSEDSMTVEAPSHEPGTVDVSLVSFEGLHSSTSASDHFEYFALAPSVSSVEPAEGPSTGGSIVTIEGVNLEEAGAVYFGESWAPVESATATSITTTSPEHAAGTVPIIVQGDWGNRSPASPADLYTYVAPPAPPPPPTATLSITMTGTGHGDVFLSPSAKLCESNCSETLAEGTQVLLTATPAAGSMFAGWSGAGCSGTGICVVTLSEDVQVGAAFAATTVTGSGGEGAPGGGGSAGGGSSAGGAGGAGSSGGGGAEATPPSGEGAGPSLRTATRVRRGPRMRSACARADRRSPGQGAAP